MEKSREYVRENLQGSLNEEIRELSDDERQELKIEINTLLHTYLRADMTLSKTETLSMLILETITNPDYFLS